MDPKVTALVYVAARAPDAGEDFVDLSGKFPVGPVRAGIQANDGFTRLSEESFLKYFANGVEPKEAEVLYAVQEPTAASLFGERTTAAAWHSKPSWYAVSKLDQTINPDLERFLAKRMNATTVELEAGHLSLVSHPKEIADLILAAAGRRNWETLELVAGWIDWIHPHSRRLIASDESLPVLFIWINEQFDIP
jgi:pimeloyl-ACP methyl ester carboxylesterase